MKFGQDIEQMYKEALKEETFVPKIDKKSKEILKNNDSVKLPVEKRLMQFEQRAKEKLHKK